MRGVALRLPRRRWRSPSVVEAGLRVGTLGRSSVRYEIALRERGAGELAAEGWFVHVFVDRATRRPAEIRRGCGRARGAGRMSRPDVVSASEQRPMES